MKEVNLKHFQLFHSKVSNFLVSLHTEIQSHPSVLVRSNLPTVALQNISVYPTQFTSNYGPVRPQSYSNYGPVRPLTLYNITTRQPASPSPSFHTPI